MNDASRDSGGTSIPSEARPSRWAATIVARESASTPSRSNRTPRTSAEQPEPLRPLDSLGAIADLQLAIQRARVLLDRVRRQVQLRRDLRVGGALGDQVEDLALAIGEQRLRRLALG